MHPEGWARARRAVPKTVGAKAPVGSTPTPSANKGVLGVRCWVLALTNTQHLTPKTPLRTRSSEGSERRSATPEAARSSRAGFASQSGVVQREDACLWNRSWRFEPFPRSRGKSSGWCGVNGKRTASRAPGLSCPMGVRVPPPASHAGVAQTADAPSSDGGF